MAVYPGAIPTTLIFFIPFIINSPIRILRSGYRNTSGILSDRPYGFNSGFFVEDYTFDNSGDLDECNGQKFEGKYVYFATDTFPFFPRCHWGKISKDFIGRGG